MIVSSGNHQTLSLPAGEILTVESSVAGAGTIYQLADSVGGQAQSVSEIAAEETQKFGPYTGTKRFDIVCVTGYLTYSNAVVDLTALQLGADATAEIAATRSGPGSFQPVAVDLELDAGAGTSDAGDTDFLAPIMGNALGDTLSKTHNYIAGVIGAHSITGTRGSLLPVAAILGILMDGSVNADAIVLAHIDGSDPSAATRARAAFGVSIANDHAGSGVDYGVDLFCDPPSGVDALFSSLSAQSFAVAKAIIRSPSGWCLLEGAGAPVDGTTGDNFAAIGSIYIDNTTPDLYMNVGTITDSVWKKFTRAA